MRRKAKKKSANEPMNVSSHDLKEQDKGLWAPNFRTVLSLFCVVRLLSALTNTISDCDETFNYWEPLHYIIYGNGLQTWEYSPIYALRSYLYLDMHKLLAQFGGILVFGFPIRKLGYFYGLRALLGFLCALTEASFYRGVVRQFGHRVGRYLLLFLALSPGMFHSSTAFLPSSFAMYALMALYACWFAQYYALGIFIGVLAVLSGWPYVALLFTVFAIDTFAHISIPRAFCYGFAALVVVLSLEIADNYHYYRKIVVPAFNIVRYNVLESSSTLYGTEPWTFYLINGGLNFNIVFALSFISMLAVFAKKRSTVLPPKRAMVYLLPLYLWMAVMFVQPHKEERFLFPVYPLICLSAAYLLAILYETISPRLARLTVLIFAVCSISRICSLHLNYHAPIDVFQHLHDHLQDSNDKTTVCMGKEWYRFPSHFFLPEQTQLQFLESGFRGQLPQQFNETWRIPLNMNDQNLEERSRYVSLETCDFVVDLVLPSTTDAWIEWEQIVSVPFLNAQCSRSFFRAFYIPYFSSKYTSFSPYVVFKRS